MYWPPCLFIDHTRLWSDHYVSRYKLADIRAQRAIAYTLPFFQAGRQLKKVQVADAGGNYQTNGRQHASLSLCLPPPMSIATYRARCSRTPHYDSSANDNIKTHIYFNFVIALDRSLRSLFYIRKLWLERTQYHSCFWRETQVDLTNCKLKTYLHGHDPIITVLSPLRSSEELVISRSRLDHSMHASKQNTGSHELLHCSTTKF